MQPRPYEAAAVTLIFLCVIALVCSSPSIRRQVPASSGARISAEQATSLDALVVARAVATADKQVMLAVANLRAVMTLLPTLLLSMRLVPTRDISQNLIVEVDSAPALQACQRMHRFCTIQAERAGSPAAGSRTADYDLPNYWALNWISIRLARQLLDQGFTVLNVDVDVALMQDPFDTPAMGRKGTADVVAAQDSPSNEYCLGFIMFRPTKKAKALLDLMLQLHANPRKPGQGKSEQDLFNKIFREGTPPLPDASVGIQVSRLDDSAFTSLCDLSAERAVLPNQAAFAKKFGDRLRRRKGGIRRLFGVHMNCCLITDKYGSRMPPACKMAAQSALLEWQALYADSMSGSAVVWS